ncbi:prephenate dehydratase [Gemmatimonadetes bacterium T265]|nr:prephenate dehydratase [Gemmatimonadetes bacterium T265]
MSAAGGAAADSRGAALGIPSGTPTAPGAAAAPRVAFQGEHGAYSEEAVVAWWDGAATPVPARECADVAAAVAGGAVDYGLLPVENTLAGSVVATYDALAAADGVAVVGEVVLPIHHCVLAPAGATLASVTTVESHPVALAQCRRFLADHPWIEARAAYDTAGAARAVAERGDARVAAIAGRAAARRFGLAVLAADVEDRPDNQTRFLVLARAGDPLAGRPLPAGAPARTALLAVTENAPGALLRLLAPLAAAGLNLSKLESRPTGTPWTYRFFLEVEHAAGDARLPGALGAVTAAARALRVLGTFARGLPGA